LHQGRADGTVDRAEPTLVTDVRGIAGEQLLVDRLRRAEFGHRAGRIAGELELLGELGVRVGESVE